MSTKSSPTTPKAKPAEVAASSPPPSPIADNLERMQYYKARHTLQDLGDRFAGARSLTPTRAPSPPPPRNSSEYDARAASTLPPSAPMFGPSVLNDSTGGGVYVAPDGSHIRSSMGFRVGTVPGNYRSPFDHNMVHRAPGHGVHSLNQQYHTPGIPFGQVFFAAPHPVRAASTYAPVLAPVPASAPGRQIQAVIPLPEASTHLLITAADINLPQTPQRLILLGPLRMIRSQCVKKDVLSPILVWLDQFMSEELHTPIQTDALMPNVVYAVNTPMDEEHWRDWNKVLAVFPRAAAWQEALTPGEPFDQVTADHGTMVVFREGEALESLLADLVRTYNLGVRHDVNRTWALPGQTGWQAPMARQAHARH